MATALCIATVAIVNGGGDGSATVPLTECAAFVRERLKGRGCA